MYVLTIMTCLVLAVAAAPKQSSGKSAAQPPEAPFVAGYTAEVLQARNNFHDAYNYLAELARLAPDDPIEGQTTLPTPTPAAPTTSAAQPPPANYQFGGLTPDVALATSEFFKHYVAAANRASAAPDDAVVGK